jgi:hypothetical protein
MSKPKFLAMIRRMDAQIEQFRSMGFGEYDMMADVLAAYRDEIAEQIDEPTRYR